MAGCGRLGTVASCYATHNAPELTINRVTDGRGVAGCAARGALAASNESVDRDVVGVASFPRKSTYQFTNKLRDGRAPRSPRPAGLKPGFSRQGGGGRLRPSSTSSSTHGLGPTSHYYTVRASAPAPSGPLRSLCHV